MVPGGTDPRAARAPRGRSRVTGDGSSGRYDYGDEALPAVRRGGPASCQGVPLLRAPIRAFAAASITGPDARSDGDLPILPIRDAGRRAGLPGLSGAAARGVPRDKEQCTSQVDSLAGLRPS